ncbi:MAG: hypothetical protein M3P51_02610, partial [Chloroflexota bacterium]|nr:hypothetical protein [Chloroflexota bacterium]
AYRYILDHWPPEHTVQVRSVASDEAVATISDYIRFRSLMGLPIRVYIDADSTTRLWPRVAEAARASGAQVLVTVRTEDWQRYAIESLSRLEVIEPSLEREEAARIFSVFKERHRIGEFVDSADWAYERLSPPHLLLEFVYLITHGEMLQDRLRDQIRQFQLLNEDPSKIDILRLVSLASALGATVSTDRLIDIVQFRDDPQTTIQSLTGEFLTVDDGKLEGLHWVRSEHIAHLLHEGGIVPVTRTVLRLANLVPSASLPFLVANAMQWEGIDRLSLLQGLVDRFGNEATESVLLVIDGLFEAGERDFFRANHQVLQEAYDLVGSGGVFLVGTAVAPIIALDITQTMITSFGEKSGAFPRLKKLIDAVQPARRGLDLVREFLSPVVERSSTKHLGAPNASSGRILDWCALAGVAIPDWPGVCTRLSSEPPVTTWTKDDLCWFSQGLFRVDREAYQSWFARHRRDLLACLQLHAECLTLVMSEPSSVVSEGMLEAEAVPSLPTAENQEAGETRADEIACACEDADANGRPIADVAITFPVELGVAVYPHEQTIRRLDTLRAALPACGRYCSEGEYLLLPGFPMPYDDTKKRIFRWHLPLPSDVAKNVVWRLIAERAFLPDTLYRFQQHWYDVRNLILEITRGLSSVLKRGFQGKELGTDRAFGKDQELIKRFEDAVRALPNISEESLRAVTKGIPLVPEKTRSAPSGYVTAFQNFRRQLWDYSHTHERQTGRLLMFNLRDALHELTGMHRFFAHLFRYSPDYFGARTLNDLEIQALSDLVLLVDASVEGRMVFSDRPLSELRGLHRLEAQQRLARFTEAAGAIPGVILPSGFVEKRWERSTALVIPVSDPQLALDELLAASLALAHLHEEIDTVWLVPTYMGARLSPGGHSINLKAVSELADEEDEAKTAMVALRLIVSSELPPEVDELLPDLPVRAATTPPLYMRVAGIRPVVEMLVQRRQSIEAIGSEEDHPCLKELREKLAGGLVAFNAEVTNVVDTAAADLASLARAVDPEYNGVMSDVAGFLNAARAALHSVGSGLDFLARWSAEDAESLAEALSLAC